MNETGSTLVITEVTDPFELAKARAQRERFDRNWSWLQAHVDEVYAHDRGRCICVAGEELFVTDDPEQVVALAQAAHPDDDGFFVRYIPKDNVPRIYANRR